MIQGYGGKNPEKDFKLTKAIHSSNMFLWSPRGGIKKYESSAEILKDYVKEKIQYVAKRKQWMLETVQKDMKMLEYKSTFIRLVTDGKLVVFKQKRAVIEEGIKKFLGQQAPCDKLMALETYRYTIEYIQELEGKIQKLKAYVERLNKKSPEVLWLEGI